MRQTVRPLIRILDRVALRGARHGLPHPDSYDRAERHEEVASCYVADGHAATLGITPCNGPVDDGLDTTAQAGSRLRLAGPDRLQYLEHHRQGDVPHRRLAQYGRGVHIERPLPLLCVLGVLPALLMRGDVPLGRVTECHAGVDFCDQTGTRSACILDGVDALRQFGTGSPSRLPCIRQRDGRIWLQTTPDVIGFDCLPRPAP